MPGIDIEAVLLAVGYAGLFAIIFAESGLLIGFFLPGDSLLFAAGFLASQGYFNIAAIIAGCFFAAVLGDSVGYAFGRRVGPALFRRKHSFLFNPQNLRRAHAFYERHGGKTIMLARFLPVIRTFAPILAGVGNMRYRAFLAYNVLGAVLWAIGLPIAGYTLGRLIPSVDRYLIPIIIAIVWISVLPSLIHILRDRGRRHYIVNAVARYIEARPRLRYSIGIFLVVFGLVALILPLVPFSWVMFIGFQLMGVHILSAERLLGFLRRRPAAPSDSSVSDHESR
ncbi:DedA family protein [Candidatus Parcubacteria bacterium]|nr:MAG: DedA family protein [Candidatus Parcubacteria bacterium]